MNKSSSVLINRRTSRTVFANIVEQRKAIAEGKQLRIAYVTDNTNSILATLETGAVETTVTEYERYSDDPVQVSVSASALPQEPAAPTILAADVSNGEIIITFTEPDNGGSQILNYEYSVNDGTSYSVFSPDLGPIKDFAVEGLVTGTTYSIRIRAVNSIGSGEESDRVYITQLPGTGLQLLLDGSFVDISSSTIWRDTSGKTKNGTLHDSPTWTSDNSGAYIFNGSNNYVDISSGFSDFTKGLTILAFVKFGSVQNSWERILDFGQGPEYNNILFSRGSTEGSTDSDLRFQIYNGLNQSISLNTVLSSGIIENAWGFYVARLDGATYLLRNQNTSTSGSTTVLPANVTRTLNYIGRSNWADPYFEGRMGVVAVYNTALSNADISGFFDIYKGRYFSAPAAPTGLSATAGDGQVSISFTAGSNNGSAIINYQYSTDNGASYSAFSSADTTSPVVITGLINGLSYDIKLRAVNAIGAGAESATVTARPRDPPSMILPTLTGKELLIRLEGNEISSYPGSGSTWFDIDEGTNTYNGTLVNTPTYDSTTAGGVFTFDSAQQEYVQIADNINLRARTGSSNYKSVVLWVYVSTEPTGGLFSKQATYNDFDGYSITFTTNRRLILNMNGSSVNGNYVTPSTNVYNLNEWTMITGIICFGGGSGNPSKLYVNTTEVLSQANSESGVNSLAPIRFPEGIQGYNSYSSCSIGAVYYYNGVLSSGDISTLYNATKSRYGL